MKKIAILGLHLNYGGVEQAIVNQANFLCEKYEVELVIFYKLLDKPAFEIDSRVKVTYLTELKPNREEFKDALKKLKIIKVLKEGIKAIKILRLKKVLVNEYINKSDADAIISSRVEYTELLSKSKNKSIVKIAVEHRHHNNKKSYINRLKRACRNIDYLIAVSKELCDFYLQIMSNINCLFIPNSLNYWPSTITEYNSKKLVSIGRLSKEKGFLDLLDVFKIINNQDHDYILNIIGDGVLRDKIEKRIKKLGLENNVILHGYRGREYINNILKESSIYLMCSYEESFGIVLIESESFGIPVIAFDSAQGAKELIKNGYNGYLISNRNIEEMANKVIELFNNKKDIKSMGNNARLEAELYSFENIKRKWLDFMENIL